ncbi:MAG: hypothetical protein AAF809_08200 [Bacteroidota bacterium]
MSEKINYTKEAFMLPWNLVFLILAMTAAFLLNDVAAVPEIILTFTAAMELLYLGIMPRNERFQRAVKSRAIKEERKPLSDSERFKSLEKVDQKRYVRFRTLEKQIADSYKKLPYASQGLLENHLRKLDGLLDSYLNLLLLKDRYAQFTRRTAEDEVVQNIAQLRRDMADDPPRVAAIKKRRLVILEKRLGKFKKAHENLAIIEAQLETIEDVTKYIYEQSLTMRNPEELSFQLDTLVSEVEETQASVEEIEDIFAGPSGELLDELDEPLLDLENLESLPDETTTTGTRDRTRG